MIAYNLHQHTRFSDGKGSPSDFAVKAIETGMTSIGFSEHSPLPFDNPFSLHQEKVDDYIAETDKIREDLKDQLEIYRALEMDFIPGVSSDFNFWRQRCRTDYLIGSVHLVRPDDSDLLWFTDGPDYKVFDQGITDLFGGDARKAVRQFFRQTNEMISTQRFEIIGHFDKVKMHNGNRYFHDEDEWYRKLIDETVRLIREKEIIVEINTRGKYKKRCDALFPDGYALEKVRDLDIPVIISSDAHHPDEMRNLFGVTENRIRELGFRHLACLENGRWTEKSL
ncbi:MAG: histidinol-phosphatase [bacterium]